MTDDAPLRAVLQRQLADEPEMRLSLESVLTAGRRSRARRHAAAVAASAVAVGAAVAASFVITGGAVTPPADDAPSIATSPSEPAPTHTGPRKRWPKRGGDLLDLVADKRDGGVPALIDSRVAVHLPGADLTDRTATSTTWGSGRIPWEHEPYATEWQVSYGARYPGAAVLTVWPRFSPTPHRDLEEHCDSVRGSVRCGVREWSGGTTLITQESFDRESRQWSRAVWHLRASRFTVGVIDQVKAESWNEARRSWRWSVDQLTSLATDPQLELPEPVVWPDSTDSDPADLQLPG